MAKTGNHSDWIAVDWGTSNLRATALSGRTNVIDRAESSRGMAELASGSNDFEGALLELISPWLRDGECVPVLACGMIGARQGWFEVPYDPAPCDPRTNLHRVSTESKQISLCIFAGVKQDSPPDVMRGEETQVSGLLSQYPDFEGRVCLPGTHSKWVKIASGKIHSFTTFLTGELFSVLTKHSILRHTLSGEGLDEESFLASLRASMRQPETTSARLFALRAEALLEGLDGVVARSRLAGILLGLELAGLGDWEDGETIALVGSVETLPLYDLALRDLGLDPAPHDAESMTLAGLAKGIES